MAGASGSGGYLGYDPLALNALATALRRTAGDLRRVTVTDPAASHARSHLRSATDDLEHWARITVAIATCSVMEGYDHVTLEADLTRSIPWTWQQHGLVIVTDPLPSPSLPDLRTEAVASATLLRERRRGTPGSAPLSDDEIVWLVASMERWAGDRGAMAAWQRAMGTEGVVSVLEQLARTADRHERRAASRADSAHRWDTTPEPASHTPAHRLLALIAAGLVPDELPSSLADLSVDAASRVLEHLHVPAGQLAEAAWDIVRRWAATADWWVEGGQTERNVADRVLGAVAVQPVAARTFVMRLSDEHLPLALFGPNDADIPRRLWLAATDPSSWGAAETGPVVRDLLAHLQGAPLTATEEMVRFRFDPSTRPLHGVDPEARWHHIRAWTGEVVAPWQPYLTGLADAWGWSFDDGLEALRWVASHPVATGTLADGIGPSLGPALHPLPDDPRSRERLIDQLAWSVGASDQVLRDAAVDEVVRQRWLWSLVSFAAHRGTGAAVGALTGGAATPLPQLAGTLANGATNRVIDHLDGDEEAEQLAIRVAGLDRLQVARTALVTGLFHELVRTSRIPPQTPPPPLPSPVDHRDPGADDPLITWIKDAPIPEDARVELMHAAGAVSGASDRGALAAS